MENTDLKFYLVKVEYELPVLATSREEAEINAESYVNDEYEPSYVDSTECSAHSISKLGEDFLDSCPYGCHDFDSLRDYLEWLRDQPVPELSAAELEAAGQMKLL